MYFLTFQSNGKTDIGFLTKDKSSVIPLKRAEMTYFGSDILPDNMQELIEQGDAALDKVRGIIAKLDDKCLMIPLNEVRIMAPIERPRKNIFCVGMNYMAHALEIAGGKDTEVPKLPIFFSKPPTCIVGHNDIVKNHKPVVKYLDYEIELAVVIAKKAFRVTKETAYDYVFGYTIMNDVTARELQKNHGQWFLGKSPDTFGPMGPYIAHKSEIPNPHSLELKCFINGELRQNSNTGDMIFDIPTLIATLSSVVTLEPGDIIATGTPSGVGVGFEPKKFLNPGDEMRLEIEKIGVLVNTIEK